MSLRKLSEIAKERNISARSLRTEAHAGRLKTYRVTTGSNAPILTTDEDFDRWLHEVASKRANRPR